ncbi:hypothetical protein H9Q73_010827 [Fusarium xylarioides]|nr:hypothetical protein H9Q73_010827 [Fusarium xylarioides]
MAGHYAKFIPVVHIVGYPTVDAVRNRRIMHHSLGNGKFDMYENMAKNITAATVVINCAPTAAREIDGTLTTMMRESRPVYIGLSVNIAYEMIDAEGLNVPIPTQLHPNDPALEEGVVEEIRKLMERSHNPAIIVDGGAVRNGVLEESHELIKLTAMGKGGLDEAIPQFAGVHSGAGTLLSVKVALRSVDTVIWIGNYPSDFNTGEFTTVVNKDAIVIDLQRFTVSIGKSQYPVSMKHVLRRLVDSLCSNPISLASRHVTWDPYSKFNFQAGDELKQDFLWGALSSFFRPGDVIIGSMHLTIQAMTDTLRWDLKPIIFMLNNGGYTVERLIHGKDAFYNEVAVLDYSILGKTFGPAFESKYHGPIKTCGELSSLLQDPGLKIPDPWGKFLGLDEAVVPLFPNSDYQTGLVGAAAAIQALLARTQENVTFDIDISLTQYNIWYYRLGSYSEDQQKALRNRDPQFSPRHYDDMSAIVGKTHQSLQKIRPEIFKHPEYFWDMSGKEYRLDEDFKVLAPAFKFEKSSIGWDVSTGRRGRSKAEWIS